MAASKDKARAILSYATPNPVGPYKLVTPLTPKTGAETTRTPVMPVMGGTLVNLPAPVMPTKQTTPVAPPLPGRLVNVPNRQGRVVNKTSVDDIVAVDDAVSKFYGEVDRQLRRGEFTYANEMDAQDKRIVDAVSNANDSRIKDAYKRELERDGSAVKAAGRVAYALRSARANGFSQSVAPTVSFDTIANLYALPMGEMAVKDRNSGKYPPYQTKQNKVRMIEMLPDEAQETLASLAPGWSGTFVELVDAARSLSK